jgi:hypothetical protein
MLIHETFTHSPRDPLPVKETPINSVSADAVEWPKHNIPWRRIDVSFWQILLI